MQEFLNTQTHLGPVETGNTLLAIVAFSVVSATLTHAASIVLTPAEVKEVLTSHTRMDKVTQKPTRVNLDIISLIFQLGMNAYEDSEYSFT